MKTSTKNTTAKVISQKFLDATCATIAKGGTVSELTLLLAGYTRAQIDELYGLVGKRIRVYKSGGWLREVDGIPVWGDTEWVLSGCPLRAGGPIVGRKLELHELSRRGLSVTLYRRRSRGYLELPELMAEVAAAKELLAA
jgi:hypothetical protein